ncbi:MAG: YdcF family protein [Syntrophomonadaceae bacterium]|nr:YdcF family protein [Syntrophomonadaceae bacterium]
MMKIPGRCFSRKLILSLAIILSVVVLLRLSLPSLGTFLVAEDEPQQSDLIVLLMGSGPDRMLGAVDLYQAGYADKIVMVRNMVRGYDLVVSQGIKIPHDVDIAKEVAVQLEVPAEKVNILPGDALSTQDEAIQVREFLKSQKDIDSLILVTSKYHSGRAKKIFVKAMSSMDREVKVISCPTSYDDFNAESWWKSQEDLKRGALEYLKLFHFYIREQFEL